MTAIYANAKEVQGIFVSMLWSMYTILIQEKKKSFQVNEILRTNSQNRIQVQGQSRSVLSEHKVNGKRSVAGRY